MTDFDNEYWDQLHFAEVYQMWCEDMSLKCKLFGVAPLSVPYDTMIQPGCG